MRGHRDQRRRLDGGALEQIAHGLGHERRPVGGVAGELDPGSVVDLLERSCAADAHGQPRRQLGVDERAAGALIAVERAGHDGVVDAAIVVLARDGDEILSSDAGDLAALLVASGTHAGLVEV